MSQRTVYLETFGCQMNKLDSELVTGELVRRGFRLTRDEADADVVLFNTCSVREHAEQKVYSRLGGLKRRKLREPELVLGIIGCMAENVREDLFRRVPHLDLICGPGELHRVPELVEQAGTERTQAVRTHGVALAPEKRKGKPFADADDDPLERLDLGRSAAWGAAAGMPREEPWRAYLRVQRGCNHMCAFCIVPYTRGKEVYRPPANIRREVEGLVDDGVVELTLLGQNINSYRWEEDGRTWGLGDLIRMLDDVPGLRRVRFVTSHPADMDDDILRAVGSCRKAAPYLHMPAQHGSDDVLRRMRRGYTRAFYLERAARARELIPDVSIASDFIVGFPGETDEDFEQTVTLIREARFKSSFIFKYSPRPGTPATKLPDDVPDAVKRERNRRLLAVQEEVSAAENRSWVGRTVEVLCDGPSKRHEAGLVGAAVSGGGAINGKGPVAAGVRVRPAITLPLVLAGAAGDATSGSASGGACSAGGHGDGHDHGHDHQHDHHAGEGFDPRLDAEPFEYPVGSAAGTAMTEGADGAAGSGIQLHGRTGGDRIVVFDGPAELRGRFVQVRVTRSGPLTLWGELV